MIKEKEKCPELKKLMGTIEGVELKDKHGGKFWFRMHLTKALKDTRLEDLDMKMRPYNSLKRAGYNTVGDVVNAIKSGNDLSRIRNCGKNSIQEIMESLFFLQYNSLPIEKRETYLMEVVALNMKKNEEKLHS